MSDFNVRIAWGMKVSPYPETAARISMIDSQSKTDKLIKEFQDKIFWAFTSMFKNMLIRKKAVLLVRYWILGYRKGKDIQMYSQLAERLTAYFPRKEPTDD